MSMLLPQVPLVQEPQVSQVPGLTSSTDLASQQKIRSRTVAEMNPALPGAHHL